MLNGLVVATIFPGLFVLILCFLELGRRARLAQLTVTPERSGAGVEVVEGAIFGLMALLIAFTFSGAASRFDSRRSLVVDEANCIGTAYLRIDLLPEAHQPALREKFRQYADDRLEMYRAFPDLDTVQAAYARSTQIQNDIWKQATVAVASSQTPPVAVQIIPAINEMFDIANTRFMAIQFHTPLPIILLLIFLTWFCSFLAGFRMSGDGTRKWAHMIIFAALMSLTIYMIIDFEFPRVGIINLDKYDEALLSVRASMQ